MARTILFTFGLLVALLCVSATIPAVLAADVIAPGTPTITVTQGNTVTISVDASFGTDANANEITVSVPGINYYRNLALSNSDSPRLVDSFIVTAVPGSYAMSVRIGRDGQTLRFTQYALIVLPPNTQQNGMSTTNAIVFNSQSNATTQINTIKIDPIPDMFAGESFVLPVTITGNGDYTIEIPNLGFARYELPNPVTISGTMTVPVLIQLKDDVAPGTYMIPVSVAGQTATARIRIIAYHEEAPAWLIPVGIALIIIALILLLVRLTPMSRTPPRSPPKQPRDDESEKLITYY